MSSNIISFDVFKKIVSDLEDQYEEQAKLKAVEIVEKAFANASKGILATVPFMDMQKNSSLVEMHINILLAQHNWKKNEHYKFMFTTNDPWSLDKKLVFLVRGYHGGENS